MALTNAERCRARYYAKREAILAKAREDFAANREKMLARGRAQYAKHKEKRVEYAREYRRKNAKAIAAKQMAKYYANREAINERRKGYRIKHYDKIYARIQKWNKENPDRVFLYRAKILLRDQVGIAYCDIPDELAEAKVEQLKISRWLRNAQAIEARSGETGTGSIRQDESAVPAGDAPNTDAKQPGDEK